MGRKPSRSRPSRSSSAVKDQGVLDGFFLAEAALDQEDAQEDLDLVAFDEKWGQRPLCGLDEAGRGPLAGPLVAAAVILDPAVDWTGVNDSKKLTAEERDRLYERIMGQALATAVAIKSAQDVDRLNPLAASLMAMAEACAGLRIVPVLALVDGNKKPVLPCPTQAVIHGDARSLAIAAASIVAKVTRDRLMLEAHQLYPLYGFDRHKGYGTKDHLLALAQHGPCPLHRQTYRGVKPPEPGLFDD